jgi:protease I
MTTPSLTGKKILILVANGVEQTAMSTIQRDLLKAGAAVRTVGIEPGLVNSWHENTWGLYFPVDQQIATTLGSDFDALVVPPGIRGVQKLAANPHAERIIASFLDAEKPVAIIGDAVELLAAVKLASGWRVAGAERSEQTMAAAGATWAGQDMTVDRILMTGAHIDAADLAAHLATEQQAEFRAAA